MKILKFETLILILLLRLVVSCGSKSASSKKTASGQNTTPISTTTPTSTPTTTTLANCDGIPRNGSSKCYYKNIPTILASGGPYGQVWWSSTNFISTSGNSPGQFSTDATFNVRIVPKAPTAKALSTSGRVCSPFKMYATKLKVQLMLRKSNSSLGDVATLTAPLNTASDVWHFTVPASSAPLILEVINVASDSRCTGFYGTKPASCTASPYLDIPINTYTAQCAADPNDNLDCSTECVAFDIQYSIDETYDLPGKSANP